MTPPPACLCNESATLIPPLAWRLDGEAGRERGLAEAMNGFVVSKALVEDLDLKAALGRFVGDEFEGAKESELIPERIEGVRGVFASERAL